MEAEDAPQLGDRRRVIVDPQVDEPVGATAVAAVLADDEQRSRLAAPPVAACRLCGRERGEQPLGERSSGGRLECLGERVDRLLGDEDVALRRVAARRSRRLPSRGTLIR